MPHIASLVTALGGFAHKQQLVRRGARDLELTVAVRSGSVIRARQGWYTTLPATDQRVRAVRVGGRLTGLSAVDAMGGWTLRRPPLHVSLHENASRLRSQFDRHVRFDGAADDTVLHWDDQLVAMRGTNWAVDVRDALVRVILDEPFEEAVAALDWALHTGAVDRIGFEWIVLQLPNELRAIRDWVDENCESLPESLSRTRFRLRGHRVESQRRLGELEHIDLVVDDCVGVETDGDRWHRDRFEQDRSKDLDITITRLHAIRPSALAVFRDWDRVLLAVETAVATHVDAPPHTFGNSGDWRPCSITIPGTARVRRNKLRRSPEFSKGRGNRDAVGALELR